SIKRFLKTVGAGVAVFLTFMAVGYYLIGPRITISEDGRLQLRLVSKPPEPPAAMRTTALEKPLPKVEIYEKLPPDVTAGTGVIIGSREVAPFDYERYQQKRRARQQKQPEETQPPAEEPFVSVDDYFVPDDASSEPPPDPEPAPEPVEPPSAEPTAPPPPAEPPSAQQGALYRVQVGVYEDRENANQVAQSLIASGFEASIVPFQRDGRTLYRVQTLVTRDKAKADALKSQLESKGFPAVVAKVQ
ncbi:MAG: SPOR domain-containing protein, partial [Fimbriimonadales bacterium]